jgi:hypothetical protein
MHIRNDFEVCTVRVTLDTGKTQKWQAVYISTLNWGAFANSCCRRKAISITYSECVSVTVVIQHAMGLRRIVLPSVTSLALPYFSTLFHKHHDCRGKIPYWTYSVCFVFSTTLSEIFLILGRPERDIIINIHRSLCKVSVIFVRF